MIDSIIVRLYPTKEQEIMFRKSCGCARFAWNWMLGEIETAYKKGEALSPANARNRLKLKKDSGEFEWLKEVSSDAWRNTAQDMSKAFDKFYKNLKNGLSFQESGLPKYKKKSVSKLSFFHDNRKLKVFGNRVYLEKIGWVKTKDEGRLPQGDYRKDKIKVSNVRISYDNKAWNLSIGVGEEYEPASVELHSDLSIGIDLGIKELATCSDGKDKIIKNINKTKEVKRLEKKHKRISGQISRKYEMNKQGNVFVKTNNIYKLENLRKRIDRRLTNIRQNHIHQAANAIIKRKPSKIVVEDLNIKGMMKNKHLAKSVAQQKFYEFRRQLEYKAKARLGIEITVADRWFPSSKKCSCCGNIKRDLKLKDRVYRCDCGFVMDRDMNAAINLANYST